MEDAERKRRAARSWLSRAANKLDQTIKSDLISKTELFEQIEEFERRLKHLDDAQSSVENEVELT